MQQWHKVVSATVVAGALFSSSVLLAGAQELQPSQADRDDGGRVVFVQGNDPAGNQVLAYRRDRNGALTSAGKFDTGGRGGRIDGSVVDPLASQGSLIYDSSHDLLIGVNAGSDSIYAFRVDGAAVEDRQVLSSGGHFPVSVAVHDNLVYALNAGGSGSVQGYRIEGRRLRPLADSNRSLGLTDVMGSTRFLNTPGQVGFTPDGNHLIVTTKANGSKIDVFNVRGNGRLSDTPVANPSATPVPFGFTFDERARLVVGEAGTSSVSTYIVRNDGTLTSVGSQTDSQGALCWIDRDGQTYFVSNAASGSVSAFHVDAAGHPSLIGTTNVGPGTIDLDHADGGRTLYVQLGGNGMVAALTVKADGSLSPIGTVATSGTQEGIVAI